MPPNVEEGPEASQPFIFNLTLEEARRHFQGTNEFSSVEKEGEESDYNIPTLGEVFKVLDRDSLILIEIKIPRDPKIRPLYDITRLLDVLNREIHSNFGSTHYLPAN